MMEIDITSTVTNKDMKDNSMGVNTVPKSSDSASLQVEGGRIPPPPPPPPPPAPPVINQGSTYPLSSLPPPPPPPPIISFGAHPCPAHFRGGFQAPLPPNGKIISRLPQQETPTPRAPMKKLQWSKIPENRIVNSVNMWTLAGKQFSGHRLNFNELENLFAISSTRGGSGEVRKRDDGDGRMKDSGAEGIGQEKRKKPNEINLIDSKRSMNVSIFLRQFRVTHSELIGWLRSGSSELLGGERLRALLQILPEAEDIEKLAAFDGDPERLGQAERFYLELMKLPHNKLMVEALLTKEEFHQMTDYINPAIDAIILSAKDIKESAALHEIIYMVQMAGNFLNSGGYAGNAAGFKLSSMLKLTEIRANRPRLNLMHYLAQEAELQNPNLVEQLRQMKYLSEASQYSQESLTSDVKIFQQRLRVTSERIHDTEPQFQQQLSSFLKMADAEMQRIESDLQQLEQLRVELAQFFCEEEAMFQLDECIGVFNTFSQRFIKAIQENKERRTQEARAEQRRQQREQNSAKNSGQSSKTLNRSKVSGDTDEVFISPTASPPTDSIIHEAASHNSPIRPANLPLLSTENPQAFNKSCHPSTARFSTQTQSDKEQIPTDNDDMLNCLLKSTGDDASRRFGSLRKKRPSRILDQFDRELVSSPAGCVALTPCDETSKEFSGWNGNGMRRGGSLRNLYPSTSVSSHAKFVPSLARESFMRGRVGDTTKGIILETDSTTETALGAEQSTKQEHENRRRERQRRSNIEIMTKRRASVNQPTSCTRVSEMGVGEVESKAMFFINDADEPGNTKECNNNKMVDIGLRRGAESAANEPIFHLNFSNAGISMPVAPPRRAHLLQSHSMDEQSLLFPTDSGNEKEPFKDLSLTLTGRALLDHQAGKWRDGESRVEIHQSTELDLLNNFQRISMISSVSDLGPTDPKTDARSTKRWGRVFDRDADDGNENQLGRSATVPHGMAYYDALSLEQACQHQIEKLNNDAVHGITGDNVRLDLNQTRALPERASIRKEKLKRLSQLYLENDADSISINPRGSVSDISKNMEISLSPHITSPRHQSGVVVSGKQHAMVDQKIETEYNAHDEGFESESISNASVSQRNSLNSAVEVDILATPLLSRKEAGTRGSIETEPDICSTTSLFTRSIDSLVARNDLVVCESTIIIDEQDAVHEGVSSSSQMAQMSMPCIPSFDQANASPDSAVKMRKQASRVLNSSRVATSMMEARQSTDLLKGNPKIQPKDAKIQPNVMSSVRKPLSGAANLLSRSAVRPSSHSSASKQPALSVRASPKSLTSRPVKTEVVAKPKEVKICRMTAALAGSSSVGASKQTGLRKGSSFAVTSGALKEKREITLVERSSEAIPPVLPKRTTSIRSSVLSKDRNTPPLATSSPAPNGAAPIAASPTRSSVISQMLRSSSGVTKKKAGMGLGAPSMLSRTTPGFKNTMEAKSPSAATKDASSACENSNLSPQIFSLRPSALSQRIATAVSRRSVVPISRETSLGASRNASAKSPSITKSMIMSQGSQATTTSNGSATRKPGSSSSSPVTNPTASSGDGMDLVKSRNIAIATVDTTLDMRTMPDVEIPEASSLSTDKPKPQKPGVLLLQRKPDSVIARKPDKAPAVITKLIRVNPIGKTQGKIDMLSGSQSVLYRSPSGNAVDICA